MNEEHKEINQQQAEDVAAQNNEQETKDLQGQSEPNEVSDGLAACQEELAQWKNKALHVTADFQNFKRRSEKERVHWIDAAQKEMLLALLSIIDDFDRAYQEHEKREHTQSLDQWLKGFELIGKSLHSFLKKYHVEPIEQMKTFDPELHEALARVDSSEHESDAIIDVMQRGYMYKDVVLRPAKVTVAQ